MNISIDGTLMSLEFPRDTDLLNEHIERINSDEKIIALSCRKDNRHAQNFDLRILRNIKNTDKIKIFNLDGCDHIEELYRFSEITELGTETHNGELLDLAKFQNLSELSSDNLQGFKNLSVPNITIYNGGELFQPELLSQMRNLTNLYLYGTKGFSFLEIQGLIELERVILVKCNLKNLNGISTFKKIKVLTISYAHSLSNIDGVERLSQLKRLTFTCCAKLLSLDILSQMHCLEDLNIVGLKNSEFSFISKIKALKELRL
ncbi:MAG: hypothetical protein LBD17_01765, partial [Endomicrobium sp.]|nr:hypothetical protein [Endomicrobium sp.]